MAVSVSAAEALAGALGEVLSPLGHGLIGARAAQRGGGGDGQHRGQGVASALAPAGVVDVGEALGQGAHVVGGEHHLRASMAVEGVEHGLSQPGSCVRAQGTDEGELGCRCEVGVAAAHAPIAAGGSHALPVRSAVHRAPEARGVDEGLEHQQPMAEARWPVRPHAPLAQREHPRGQIGAAPTRQDHKARVVAHQVQPVVLHPQIPTDPSVARSAFPRRRGESDQRYPLIMPACDVPQCLADLGQCPQIVMCLHQALISLFVGSRNRLDDDLAQVHAAPVPRVNPPQFVPQLGGEVQCWT